MPRGRSVPAVRGNVLGDIAPRPGKSVFAHTVVNIGVLHAITLCIVLVFTEPPVLTILQYARGQLLYERARGNLYSPQISLQWLPAAGRKTGRLWHVSWPYLYEANQRRILSTRLAHFEAFDDEATASAAVQSVRDSAVGGTVPIWYDPANEELSVLTFRTPILFWLELAWFELFGCFSCYAVAHVVDRRRRRRR